MIETIASLTVPAVLTVVSLIILSGKRDYFESFLRGAKDGLKTSASLLAPMVALVASLKMLSASGALSFISDKLSPIASFLGIPKEVFPLIVTRPLSGSASSAALASLISECGADSFPVFVAAIIAASSDTIIYIAAVYFSPTSVKRTGYMLPVAFAVMIFCIFFACFLARIFFVPSV